jgi:putative tryptophan/tyrosine transport system substrate-binding protein
MKRRDMILGLGGAAVAWPLAGRAQQKAMPVIGVLGATLPDIPTVASNLAVFRQGLRESGYIEGQNVAIEYRWAERHPDRLPGLAADLVGRKVDLIVTEGGNSTTLAAKNATSTIPVVFHTSGDPVAMGLVASLARPGGNLTGVSLMSTELTPKLLELLLELVPQARLIALLVDPSSPRDIQAAALAKGVQLLPILMATTGSEADAAFATLLRLKADGLIVDTLNRAYIAALTSRHAVPAIALWRDFPDAGGLLSYGPSMTAVYHAKGIYAGKILKGAKPTDLPVQRPTKFELVINLKTANALGLTIPQSILARAHEVIE